MSYFSQITNFNQNYYNRSVNIMQIIIGFMVKKLSSMFSKLFSNIGAVMFMAVALGITIQPLAEKAYNLMTLSIMILFFIPILAVDFSKVLELINIKDISKYIVVCLARLTIIPLFIIYTTSLVLQSLSFSNDGISLGIGLRFFTSPSFSLLALVELYKGNSSKTILLILISTIISLITLPLAVSYFLGESKELSYFLGLVYTLFCVVLLPVLAGVLCKLLFPVSAERISSYKSFTISLSIAVLMIGASKGLDISIYNNPWQTLVIATCTLVWFILLPLFGWFIEFKGNKESKICSSLFFAKGSAIALLLAHHVYGEAKMVALSVVISTLMQFISAEVVYLLIKKNSKYSDL